MMRLYKIFKHLYFLTFTFLLVSCEEVVMLDLKSSSPVMVAEGLIEKDSTGWIRLSYTSDYFASTEPRYVENVSVRISDDSGNSEILSYKGKGLYKGTSLKGRENRQYILNIYGQDLNYSASSRIFTQSHIYSLNFKVSAYQSPGETKKFYNAVIKFHDELFIENFYMVKFWKNGMPDNDGYTLIRDSYYSSGDTIEYSSWRNTFEFGDTVNIRLYSIDRNSYAYYSQLNDLSETGMGGSSTPYNPKSNFGPDILGYFGAYSFTTASSVVK